ncbi:MAG: cation:dicarboxylase symporter family transporter [Bacteroidetes bacterium]|nr:cation:dicarboxylase symporter family transporter [Bacteroidota bacterium]
MMLSKRLLGILLIVLLFIICCLYLVNNFLTPVVSDSVLAGFRWGFLFILILFAISRNTLTTYILVSMLLGAEFGHQLPGIAVHLNVIGKIFLRLIKTIIAPLLFGTLVVGIAGHANLRQIGRLGWKSIIYFEVVSTIALFIGLAAINISQAGIGVNVPANIETSQVPVIQKQSWEDIILHIFPENIARSIYEGQVLQIVVFSILFGIAVALRSGRARIHPWSMIHQVEIHAHFLLWLCKYTNTRRHERNRTPNKPGNQQFS